MSEQLRTGIIVGSFDPFTIGHDSIVRRALPLFDRLVIGVVGDNVHKPNMRPAEERMQAILDLYADESRIEVKTFHGLAMDFAKAENGYRDYLTLHGTRISQHLIKCATRIVALWS